MGIVNVSLLLEPLTGECPTGDNLNDNQQYIDLTYIAQGTPDRVHVIRDPEDPSRDIERITPGKEPDALAILESALSLFKRTKDLRVAMYIAYGATRIDGLLGLSAGTELIAGMLNQYWDEVYPHLDPDDDYDPIERTNILYGFCDPAMMLRAVKGAPLAEARAIGKFTLRDIEVANGDATPLEGQVTATHELLRAVCMEMDQGVLLERLTACKAALTNLSSIVSIFRKRTSFTPDFDPLIKVLKRAVAVYDGAKATHSVTDDVEKEVMAESQSVGVTWSAGRAVLGRVASRSDAKCLLEQACEYLEKSEPAHPSPILIRRAIRLLDMSFLDIIRELTPEAVSEIERLGGVRSE